MCVGGWGSSKINPPLQQAQVPGASPQTCRLEPAGTMSVVGSTGNPQANPCQLQAPAAPASTDEHSVMLLLSNRWQTVTQHHRQAAKMVQHHTHCWLQRCLMLTARLMSRLEPWGMKPLQTRSWRSRGFLFGESLVCPLPHSVGKILLGSQKLLRNPRYARCH